MSLFSFNTSVLLLYCTYFLLLLFFIGYLCCLLMLLYGISFMEFRALAIWDVVVMMFWVISIAIGVNVQVYTTSNILMSIKIVSTGIDVIGFIIPIKTV